LDALRWGLIPYWATDSKIAYKTINVRAETVDTAPSYREAFKKRRCLIPADGLYEWRTIGGTKIPFAIGMKDDRPFVFAGLWEGWKDPATEECESGGGSGIRTHGSFRISGFQDRCNKPLYHPSSFSFQT
jgi:putative SOS response-associated peptidase YedK